MAGGKAKALAQFLEDLTEGAYGENSRAYRDLLEQSNMRIPTQADIDLMDEYVQHPWHNAPLMQQMRRLMEKYAIDLPPEVPLYRGIPFQPGEGAAVTVGWKPGSLIKPASEQLEGMVPSSSSKSTPLDGFLNLFSFKPEDNVLMQFHRTEPVKALPIPVGGQDELLLAPSNYRFEGFKPEVTWNEYGGVGKYGRQEADVTMGPGVREKYSDGGKVSDKKPNRLDLLSKVAASPNPTMPFMRGRDKQLFLRGLLSQLYGLNDAGDPEFLGGSEWHNWPGIVDEVISMPTVLPDRFVPEASKTAAQRLEALNARLHQDMGIDPAQGFVENAYDAAGVMAGQIPTGGARAAESVAAKQAPGLLRRLGRDLSNAAEWFTPTVEATPKNYIIGTATGAGLNTLAEKPEESQGVNVVSKYAEGGVAGELSGMKRRYRNDEGSDRALKAIKSAISAIESGDHPSAVSLLRPHKDNEAVAEVLKSLGDEE